MSVINGPRTGKRGVELLRDPVVNKSTAFTEAERQALGLVGLVPDTTESEELQLHRVMDQLGNKPTDLERYIYLINLPTMTRRCSTARSCLIRHGFCRSSMTPLSARPA